MFAVWSSKPLPVSVRELRRLTEDKDEKASKASRSSRDIVRVERAMEDAECRVVVLEVEHELTA